MRIFAASESESRTSPRPADRVVIPFPVRPKRKSSGVVPPQPERQGTSAMAAHAELQDLVPDSERALAQEIAKAMQPPLMSRLARVQRSYSELGDEEEAYAPPPIPALQMPLVVQKAMPAASAQPSPAMLDLIADDPDAGFRSPPSAEWLNKARRERNRARLANVVAWIATLAIGGGIVTAAMLMLPH